MLVIDVAVQNLTGSLSYGLYFPVLNLCLIFQVILDFGLNNFVRREVARHRDMISKYFISILITKIFLGIVYFIIITSLAGFFEYTASSYHIIVMVIINQIFAELILFVRSNLGALYQFKHESIISVMDRLLMIIVCGSVLLILPLKNNFKIEWFIYCQTLSYIITLVFAITLLLKNDIKFGFKLYLKEYFAIIKTTIPYAILFLLMGIYYRIDPLLIKKLADNGQFQAGIYAHSFRLLDMLQNYGYLFSIILLPMFSRMLKEKYQVDELVNTAFLLLIIPAIIICSFSAFQSQQIISFLYKEDIVFSSKIFTVLISGFLFISTSYVFGTLLTANGNFKDLIFIAFIGVVINISLNFFLVPTMGALGAAYTSLIVQCVTSILQFILAIRKINIKINRNNIIRIAIFFIFAYVFAFLTKNLFSIFIIAFFVFAAGILVMLFILKIIDKKNFEFLLKYISGEKQKSPSV